MARALLICRRRQPAADLTDADIAGLSARITPRNAPRRPPIIVRRQRVLTALLNGEAAPDGFDGASLRLGMLASSADDWARTGGPAPEGSYALYRVASDLIEIVADAAATRTTWYAMTDDLFVASSSQRAIVAILGDFRANHEASAWMLSSGTLGPGLGWDARVRPVAPGERVVLDRNAWRLRIQSSRIDICESKRAVDEPARERSLAEAVERAAAAPRLDGSKWVLPLSGGVDSRGLLLAHLRSGRDAAEIRCVTWGQRSALEQRDSDASIARALADRLGVDHAFMPVELSTGSADDLMTRFLAAGEGRFAALSGYLDGFELWNALHEQGVEGIIRGDEAFGWKPVTTERDVRRKVRMLVLEDFFDKQAAAFDLPHQRIPDDLVRRRNESLAAWRDRLYQQFRLPCMLSALTDLKLAYVEVLNPLLYSSVLDEARRLPEDLRTDKKLWKRLVESWLPDVPFATRGAVTPLKDALGARALLELFVEELRSQRAADVLGSAAARSLGGQLEARLLSRPTRASIVPARLASLWRAGIGRRAFTRFRERLDPSELGFRATIVSRMHALLREDAAALSHPQHCGTQKVTHGIPIFGMPETARVP